MQQIPAHSRAILGVAGTCFLINAILAIANAFATLSIPFAAPDYARLAMNAPLGIVCVALAVGCFIAKRQFVGVCAILLAIFSLIGMGMSATTLFALADDGVPNEIFLYLAINGIADCFGLVATILVAIAGLVPDFARSRVTLGIGGTALVLMFTLRLCAYLFLASSDLGAVGPMSIVSALPDTLAPALALVGLHLLSKVELASQAQ